MTHPYDAPLHWEPQIDYFGNVILNKTRVPHPATLLENGLENR
jgi:hypothetical protein